MSHDVRRATFHDVDTGRDLTLVIEEQREKEAKVNFRRSSISSNEPKKRRKREEEENDDPLMTRNIGSEVSCSGNIQMEDTPSLLALIHKPKNKRQKEVVDRDKVLKDLKAGDVFKGRGGKTNDFAGNIAFRWYVQFIRFNILPDVVKDEWIKEYVEMINDETINVGNYQDLSSEEKIKLLLRLLKIINDRDGKREKLGPLAERAAALYTKLPIETKNNMVDVIIKHIKAHGEFVVKDEIEYNHKDFAYIKENFVPPRTTGENGEYISFPAEFPPGTDLMATLEKDTNKKESIVFGSYVDPHYYNAKVKVLAALREQWDPVPLTALRSAQEKFQDDNITVPDLLRTGLRVLLEIMEN